MLATMRRSTIRSAVLGLTLAGVVGTGVLGVSAAEAAPPVVKSDDWLVVTTLIEAEKRGPRVIVERDPGRGTRHADVTPKNQPRAKVDIGYPPDYEVTKDEHGIIIRAAARDTERDDRQPTVGEASLEHGPGGPTPSVGTGTVDGVKDDLRPVEELELDRLLEEFSVLLPEDLVDIDITGKLLELGDRLNDILETIQEGIGGGAHGVDAAEEFGWMYDLSKLLDELFGDDPDEEEDTPDGQGAWDDPDGNWVPNWLDNDDDGDGTPDDEDADPYDPEVSIMAGGEAGPMGTPPVPPMGLTEIDSIRSAVIDVVLMLDGDAASKLIE